jgi:glycosyltransferase involved in cell wall biosynthesis
MKIAQLAPLWIEIPPKQFGGTERVIHLINEGLARLGHEVTLFACGGSSCNGRTIEVIDKPMHELIGGFKWDAVQAYEFLAFKQLFDRLDEFDIVHNHMGIHPHAFAGLMNIPMVTTYHSSVEPDFPLLAQGFKGGNFVSISNAQRTLAPYINWVKTIYNPVDPAIFDFVETPKDYLLYVGAIKEEKGVHLAIQAALDLGEKLIIAGKVVYEKDQEYFDTKIKPLVDGSQIQYIGEVNDVQKNPLFGNAKAFLFPTQWNEAFGLVMVESLACGTPVIAYDKGAVSEVITNGENGYIVNNYDDFKHSITQVNLISREACRKSIESRFSIEVIAQQYIDLYKELIQLSK